MSSKLRVGVAGPVGSGKTALVETLCLSLKKNYEIAVVTNDIYTKEDANFLINKKVLEEGRIIGVETGGCPHTAIREDCSLNKNAAYQLFLDEKSIIFINLLSLINLHENKSLDQMVLENLNEEEDFEEMKLPNINKTTIESGKIRSLKELIDEFMDRKKDLNELEEELEKHKDDITPGQLGEA